MSAMVDRVAKAMANAWHGEDCWDALSEEAFDHFLKAARAAIKVMKQPTAAMVKDGMHKPFSGEAPRLQTDECQDTWRAMIDAALT